MKEVDQNLKLEEDLDLIQDQDLKDFNHQRMLTRYLIYIFQKTIKIKRRTDRKWDGRAGEADRSVAISKPRHLYSGKRSNGSNDRR